MPTRLAPGTTCLTKSICLSSANRSDTPVTLVLDGSQLGTSLAATGSVTAENTTGTLFVAVITAWAEGVAMATMASGLSPMNLRAICAAVPVLPWALWYCHLRFLPDSKPASLSAACTPSRTASSAGCSTIAVIATDFCAACCACAGVMAAIAKASAPKGAQENCFM